jgi:hypothetical protein
MISLEGAGWVQPNELPSSNAYIAAGMFFAESRFLKDIPFDPELDFLFIGEELLLSARFYTHGWDIYTPSRNTIYHMYTREKDPKFWDNKHIEADIASEKVRFILGLVPTDEKLTSRQKHYLHIYGLGSKRTLEEYFAFAGIYVKDKKIEKNLCEQPITDPVKIEEDTQVAVIVEKTSNTYIYIILFILLVGFMFFFCVLFFVE